MKKILLGILFSIFTTSSLLAAIYLNPTSIPTKLVNDNGSENITIEWLTTHVTTYVLNFPTVSTVPASCELRYALSKGTAPTHYTLRNISQTSPGKLTFNSANPPSQYGMLNGNIYPNIYYCRIFDKTIPGNYSEEFPLYIGVPKIYCTKIPLKLLKSDGSEAAEIEWLLPIYNPITQSSEPASCKLRYALSPGTAPVHYTLGNIDQTSIGKLTFNSANSPSKNNMNSGVFYCRIFDNTNANNYSDEFPLYVESANGPTLTEPVNGSRTDSPRPTFKWNKISGVPYYTIMVFDRQITIKEEKNEKGENEWKITTPDGSAIKPVWQAVTADNNLVYGTPGLSVLSDVYQPLLGGTTYTWTVMNCYENNLLFTSGNQTSLFTFCYAEKPNLPTPVLLKPLHNPTSPYQEISDEMLTFEWQVSTAPGYDRPTNYHLYLYMKKESDSGGLSLSLLAWDASTSNTYFDLNAQSALTDSLYDWYVTAENAKGQSIQSNIFTFKYKKPLGYLTISAKYYDQVTASTKPVTNADVKLEATNDGSTNPYPLFTGDGGKLEKVELSPGTYKVTITKTGFETQSGNAVVASSHTKDTPALAEIYLQKSPSFIVGQVIDSETKTGIFDAKVKAVQRETPYAEKITFTDNSGGFKFSVWDNTSWNISVSKVSYSVFTTSVAVGLAETKNIVLTPTKNKNVISGTITNENGYPILTATVKIKSETAEWSVLTNETGNFSFQVGDGTWILTATKDSFVSPTPIALSVSGGQTVKKDLILTSQANRVTGYITDNQRSIPYATVKALTPEGTVVTSEITNTHGQYTLNLKGGRTYEITAVKTGYTLSASQQVTFSADASGQTNSGINLVLIPNRSYVEGKVTTDGGTGLAETSVTDGISTVKTRADGTYQLSMNEGTYQVKATKEGYGSPPAQTITIGVGETMSNIDFVLSPNASVIKGNVSSSEGTVSGATVELSTAPGGSGKFSTFTDDYGVYVFSIQNNTYYLQVRKNGFLDSNISTITVAPGQTSTGNNFSLIQNIGYVTGEVRDEQQNLLKNVSIKVTNRSGGEVARTTTDGALITIGKYTFVLQPDTYTFTAGISGYTAEPYSQDFYIIPGTTSIIGTFLMKKNNYVLSGTVYGPNNIFLKDVSVIVNGSSKTLTDINGRYKIGLDSGTYSVRVNKFGYKVSPSTGVTFEATEPMNTTKTRNFQIEYNYALIQGTITSNGLHLSGATVSIPGKTVTTGADGSFSFSNLLPGTYLVTASKSGYQETSVSISLSPGEIKTFSLAIAQASFSIQGMVIDTTSAGIPLATVRIKNTDTGLEKYTVSSSTGWYYIGNLSSATYNISVTKTNYDIYSGSSSFVLTSDISNFNFTLIPFVGTLVVTVSDDQGNPLTNAEVTAEAAGGYFGKGISDGNGQVILAQLHPIKTYTVKASKKGYELEISTGTDIPANSSGKIGLRRILGSLQGYVKKDSSGVANVQVKATSLTGMVFTTMTITDGSYLLSNLPLDTYLVGIIKIDHYGIPMEQEKTITESNCNLYVSTFTLIYSPVKELSLVLPTKIVAQAGVVSKHNFSLLTKDANGRSVTSSTPVWTIDETAGIIDSQGVFIPKSDFFGKTTVKVTLGGNTIEKEIDLWFKVVKSTNEIELQDTEGMKLKIPANVSKSSTTSEDEITVSAELPSDAKKSSLGYQVVGKGFHLQPDNFRFSGTVTISLPIPSGTDRSLVSIGRWTDKTLKWEPISSQVSGDYLQAKIDGFSEYAILFATTKGLSIENLTLQPNPFSPKVKNIQFKYFLNSDSSANVYLTIKIYNILGDLVRPLVESQPRSLGNHTDEWNGLNDDGEICLNGRYVVEFVIEEGGKSKRLLKPIVLVK